MGIDWSKYEDKEGDKETIEEAKEYCIKVANEGGNTYIPLICDVCNSRAFAIKNIVAHPCDCDNLYCGRNIQ